MIKSFAGKFAEAIWNEKVGKGFPADLVRSAQRKLRMIDAANVLNDLRAPPANRLEALANDRTGQHSIRINDQWRVCFEWRDRAPGPSNVEIVDYH